MLPEEKSLGEIQRKTLIRMALLHSNLLVLIITSSGSDLSVHRALPVPGGHLLLPMFALTGSIPAFVKRTNHQDPARSCA